MKIMNDNVMALKLLDDVTKILKAIESSNAKKVSKELTNLKEHIGEFEEVFEEFKNEGFYS